MSTNAAVLSKTALQYRRRKPEHSPYYRCIHISFATHAYAPGGFDAKYIYDRSSNSYYRYMGGYPHTDYNTGQQITVKNIVAMVSDIEGPLDQWGHMAVRTVGSGTAFIKDSWTC